MSDWRTFSKSGNMAKILDENNCPVARMRLYSHGVQTNNRIFAYETVIGDKGCLACGNCTDACPVVREKKRFMFIQNQRTSMALENMVGEECRRCYNCIRVCPQVTKGVKEFAIGSRRAEKFVHHYTASLIFLLAATGIFTFHYGTHIPAGQKLLFTVVHTIAGFFLLAAPLLYWLLDRTHFKRALSSSFRFGKEDLLWLKDFLRFLKGPRNNPLPCWKEFNTYHKFWFAYLLLVVPVLGLTGVISLIGENLAGQALAGTAYVVHSSLALMTDLLILTHIYFKILRFIFRNMSDMFRYYKKTGSLHYPFSYDPKSDTTRHSGT